MPVPYRVLFLCTGNSARSILCAAILNHLGGGRFVAYSAGSQPTGSINPYALRELTELGVATDGLRSKSWDEFTVPGAPPLDIVITVCDSAAQEPCPVFFGDFVKSHWGLPDPSLVRGDEATIIESFHHTASVVLLRIQALVHLPMARLDGKRLQHQLDAINSHFPANSLADASL